MKIIFNRLFLFLFLISLPISLTFAQRGSVPGNPTSSTSTETATASPRSIMESSSTSVIPKTTAVSDAQVSTSIGTSSVPVNSTKTLIEFAGLLLAAIIGIYVTYKFSGKGKPPPVVVSSLAEAKEKQKSKSRCLDIKKLMNDKLDEVTDLKSKLEDKVKDKSREEIKEMVKDPLFSQMISIVENGEKEYERLKGLFDQCMIEVEDNYPTILVDAEYCFTSENGEVFEEMHNLLEKYLSRKIIVTGANDEQYKKWKLNDMPYEVFTLKHKPEKTDPKYFESLLKKYEVTAAEVIYFEHNPDAVKSAESVGIKTYYYDEKKKDLNDLKKFLDENL